MQEVVGSIPIGSTIKNRPVVFLKRKTAGPLIALLVWVKLDAPGIDLV